MSVTESLYCRESTPNARMAFGGSDFQIVTHYSLSHKSLNTVPFKKLNFIVGAGPCARPLFPRIRHGGAQGPRSTNDL